MELLKTEPHLVPFIQCLKDFRDIKDTNSVLLDLKTPLSPVKN